ncbi:MAG: hypothetical protein BMS9Abin20_0510 [Acidimicrobiia bacterium]|nr:MAG: hypothetical protein BMS9Abin20_0510 [Acidimicrobiia bacterium]
MDAVVTTSRRPKTLELTNQRFAEPVRVLGDRPSTCARACTTERLATTSTTPRPTADPSPPGSSQNVRARRRPGAIYLVRVVFGMGVPPCRKCLLGSWSSSWGGTLSSECFSGSWIGLMRRKSSSAATGAGAGGLDGSTLDVKCSAPHRPANARTLPGRNICGGETLSGSVSSARGPSAAPCRHPTALLR